MEIEYLCDRPHFADIVARWIYDEFIKDVNPYASYEDVLRVYGDCGKSAPPIRLAAVENGECVGTVSIVSNDLSCRDYTPWLAGLYVAEVYRGQGIGERLAKRVIDIATGLGYPELYLRTENAGGYYRKLGWLYVESCDDFFGLEPEVYKYTLIKE